MAADPSTDRITELRLQLKAWEHTFAKTHSGTKPSTADIKADPPIAAKYKEYYKLLKPSKPSKDRNSTPPPPTPKRPPPPSTTVTPSRSTGALPWTTTNQGEVYESPVSVRRQRLFGNRTTRDCVGPTPQKTGRVLGLFDSFTDVSLTPTKTPLEDAKSINRASASPLTPRKRKRLDQDTPSKRILQTPTALRARCPPTNELMESPPAFRPPPRPKRGLSSMLAELRELEEHALDDEEEAMRDIEMEADGIVKPPKPKRVIKEAEPELPPLPPGAFREEELVDEDAGKEVGERRWKKKGLKRQTRRVKMRPVTVPRSKAEGEGNEEPGTGSENEEDGEDSGSEFEGEDKELGASKRAKKSASQDASSAKTNTKEDKKSLVAKGKEVVKKAGRKISNTAHSHMNFRKLNIKNKNSKGKGGGGRWGRRR